MPADDHIIKTRYDGVDVILCDAKTRKPLTRGSEVIDFRGEKMRVTGGCPPHKASAAGYIDVIYPEDSLDDVSPFSYYVSVFNAVWLGVGEANI